MILDPRHCRTIALDPGTVRRDPQLRTHAERCPDCAGCVATATALAERVRALPALAAPMPEGLKSGLLAQLEACPEAPTARPRPAARWRRAVMPTALAASLVLGIVLGRTVEFGRPGVTAIEGEVPRTIADVVFDVTHDHYLFSRLDRPLEHDESEAGALQDWLSGSLGFAVRVPEGNAGLALQGGRIWHTLGRIASLAAYDAADGARVILFAVPAENIALEGAPSTMIRGTRVYTGTGWDREARVWIEGDLAVAVAAPEGRLPADWADTFLPPAAGE